MDVDQDDFSFDDQLLYHILRKNNEKAHEIMKCLNDLVSKVDGSGNTLLHYVAQCSNDTMVKYLIDSGAKVHVQNQEGQTPLWLALDSYYNRFDWEECKRKSVLNLLDANADMHICDNQGKSPLSNALATDGSSVLVWLFQKLNNECLGNSEKIAEKLMKANSSVYRNFDVNARSNRGSTPLLYALSYYGVKLSEILLKFLLRHGADLNAKDQWGMTALMHLCRFRYLDYSSLKGLNDIERDKRVVEYLLQYGADPQVVTPNGDTVFNNEEPRRRVHPAESVLAHLAMLEERGTPIKEIIRNQINKNEKYKSTIQMHREQLQTMKKMKIWKSLTLHELLIGKEGRIKSYLRENGFTLKLNRLSNKYTDMSYYCYAMRERISRILYSIKLKKEVAVTMTKITGIGFEGYPIVLDKVCSYLTKKDMLSFCQII